MKTLAGGKDAPVTLPEPTPLSEGIAALDAPLQFLVTEMAAMMGVLPGGAHRTEAQRLADEAATEAGFDNMPV